LDDLTEVIRTCDVIEIEDCTPHYLRAFIVGRLKVGFPLVADKVGRYNPEQMHALCGHIKSTHILLR
jgi:hypothetical protein